MTTQCVCSVVVWWPSGKTEPIGSGMRIGGTFSSTQQTMV